MTRGVLSVEFGTGLEVAEQRWLARTERMRPGAFHAPILDEIEGILEDAVENGLAGRHVKTGRLRDSLLNEPHRAGDSIATRDDDTGTIIRGTRVRYVHILAARARDGRIPYYRYNRRLLTEAVREQVAKVMSDDG